MKSKIVFLGLFLMCIFSLNAQKEVKDFDNKSLVSSGTYFDSKITDSKWSNSNGKSYTKAKFSDYTGTSHANLSAKKTMSVFLDYKIELKKGGLTMEVADGKGNVIFKHDFTQTEEATVTVDLKKEENYQIRFTGKQAKGSYFCQWKEK